MTQPVEIRRLHLADAEHYRTIRLAALEIAPQQFGSALVVEASRPMSHFAERLTSSAAFGAFAQDRIVGLSGYKREDGPKYAHKAFVWGFFVQPEWRRRGVGSALIAALIAAARGEVEQLTLSVVQGNTAAIALYEKFGFAVYGVEPRALKDVEGYSDEVLMALRL